MGDRFQKQSKLCLPKRSTLNTETVQSPALPRTFGTVNQNNVDGGLSDKEHMMVRPFGNVKHNSVQRQQQKNPSVSTTASILKRVRRFNVKENVLPSTDLNTIFDMGHSDVNSPVTKRVRIITPSECFEVHQEGSVINNIVTCKNINNDNIECINDVNDHKRKTIQQEGVDLLNQSVHNFVGADTIESEHIVCKVDAEDDDIYDEINEDNDHTVGMMDSKSEYGVQRNRRRNKKDFEHWMEVRFQPKLLTDALQSLSYEQKQWLKRTGFGSLLSFRMNEYPQALCYYIAVHYQNQCSSLCFDAVKVPISDDDVNEILGLPKGDKKLIFVRSSHTEDIWRAQFISPDRLGWKITANMVCEAMKKSRVADKLFKLNFLVLMSNILIEGPTNPYVKQTMISFSGDLDHCNQYNWCQLLLDKLNIATAAWKQNPITKRFTGSAAFLVYLYMDRVVKNKRQVRRKKPTFVGWSDFLILDRQVSDISTNTFFHGRIALPLRCKDSDYESSFEDNTWNICEGYKSDGEEVDGEHHNNLVVSHSDSKQVDMVMSVVKQHNNGSVEDINAQATRNQDPINVIDQMKDSIDCYDKIQSKCMIYLLTAKDMFKNNDLVNSLESMFLSLVKRANAFVENELHQKISSESSHLRNDQIETVKPGQSSQNKTVPRNAGENAKENLLDDDILLSTQDWDYIDSLSGKKRAEQDSAAKLFNSMESQSKTLSLPLSNSSSAFKTPMADSLFKVPLDASIPSFNLGIEVAANDNEVLTDRQGRPVRDRRVADIKRSPYIDRFTSINGKYYRKEETDMWNWLHSNKKNPNRVLFKWNNMRCYKVDFQSMMDGEMVINNAIDVWSCFLNSQEELRAPTSPRRLFCYTETTIGTLIGYNEKTIQKKFVIFKENMDHILNSNGVALKDIDLVFFPIHHVNHYYVVCYNLKNPYIDILDNKASDMSVKHLYGHQLLVLQKHMVQYLRINNYRQVFKIEHLEPERLKMYWQTKDNGIDCAIFAMRHMETYFGGGVRTWESKFAVESYTQQNQISRLRLLFTYRMLSSRINSNYDVILDEIREPGLFPEEADSPLQKHK